MDLEFGGDKGGTSGVVAGGRSENDANSALAELDQGLRCGNLGEQSEAIVRFPRLFQKYPFPILINSALLKLADIYRQSSNFIKLCVLRVCQESERHLDKITNVDEFVKRIFMVLHSNDPVARALTLRTLGAVAVIIPERKPVHHSIRNALDSHDSVELQAAIFAAGKFAAQSKNFAVNMCSKISKMIEGYSTPLDMKLKLIPIFQHMYHDAHTARVVRDTCTAMLPAYPSLEFVTITLQTLTKLSDHTLIDVPDQVELLLKYLNEDSRQEVKKVVLEDLRFLASPDRAHLWSTENVSSLIVFAVDFEGESEVVLCGALAVLCDIVKTTSTQKFILESADDAPVLELCGNCCYRNNVAVAARATQLLTLLAINCHQNMIYVDGVDISSEAVMALEALFLLINNGISSNKASSVVILQECLKCMVLFCNVYPSACEQVVDIIGAGLIVCNDHQTMILLGEILAALGNCRKGVLNALLPDICTVMTTLASESSAKNNKILSILSALLFQMNKDHIWSREAAEALGHTVDAVDAWTAYRIARTATRYGQQHIARPIIENVAYLVSSEHLSLWLTGLSQLCLAEEILSDSKLDTVDRLTSANTKILQSITSFTAASTPQSSQAFQISYLKCRSAMLQALVQLIYSCNSLRTSPPPAIANAQAKSSHDDLYRCGRITQLLRKCVKEFKDVETMYTQLYETSFDADPDTLIQLQILQTLNSNMSRWIEMVCLKSSLQGSIFEEREIEFSVHTPELTSINIQGLISMGKQVAWSFNSLANDPEAAPITDKYTMCLRKVVKLFIDSPLPMPRFFYQSRQQTSLTLAVTPTPRTVGEPIAVSTSQHMAIKVEGVITAPSSKFNWRKISSIKLTLQSYLQTPSKKLIHQGLKIPDCSVILEQLAFPHNDFFTTQFLIPFPVAGLHQVTIETELIDEDEHVWRSGVSKSMMTVKAFEDPRPSTSRNR